MDLHDFYYDLPEELIAQDPLSDRSSSRLMVLDKNTGAIEHKIFRGGTAPESAPGRSPCPRGRSPSGRWRRTRGAWPWAGRSRSRAP